MKQSGKLLRISDNLSMYILENEDESYISPEGIIRYKNIGTNFNTHFIQEHNCVIDEKGIVNILDEVGKSMMYFPAIWLDTDQMKIMGLVEKGLLKFS